MKVHNSVGAVESLEEVCLDVFFYVFSCFFYVFPTAYRNPKNGGLFNRLKLLEFFRCSDVGSLKGVGLVTQMALSAPVATDRIILKWNLV